MSNRHTEDRMNPSGEPERKLAEADLAAPYCMLRGGLARCRRVFHTTGRGRIVYLGGSITTMEGWRAMTCELFAEIFPNTEFDFVDAGIGGTNSTCGAFRFDRDVTAGGRVDLLFLEFAVNDSAAEGPDNRRVRALEGIVRKARRHNPNIDILVQYFVDRTKQASYEAGFEPASITAHKRVASHYDLPELNLALEMTRRLGRGEFPWEDFSRDSCHPKAFGHRQILGCIREVLESAWSGIPDQADLPPRPMPEPLDTANYENARLVSPRNLAASQGFEMATGWQAERTCNYHGPVDVLTATEPGAQLTFEFDGRAAAISAIAGFDAGRLAVAVDDEPARAIELFDQYCHRFHRPVFRMLAENLPPGPHRLSLTTKPDRHEQSTGTAARILNFGVA